MNNHREFKITSIEVERGCVVLKGEGLQSKLVDKRWANVNKPAIGGYLIQESETSEPIYSPTEEANT